MEKQKIVIAGGGSCFVPSKVKVILEKKEIFEDSEICLFDIDPKNFPLLTQISEELCRREKVNIKVTSTINPEKAFEGAFFIYFVWNIGGQEALKNDIAVPLSYNMIGDETAGIGGTFMAQRNIPVAINYCKMIEKICPDAWIISLTNPTNLLADAVRRETKVKFIALCDCICEFAMRWLPQVMNIPPFERHYHVSKDLWPRTMGVNHYTWLIKLMVNGKDGYPKLREIVRESKGKVWSDFFVKADLPYMLFNTFDYLDIAPVHTQLYFEQNDYIKRAKDFDNLFYSGAIGWNKERKEQIKKIAEGANYETAPFGNSKDYCFDLATPRQLIGVMASIIENDGREWGGVNTPNTGAISNLPQNSIVEVPAIINATGVNPVFMGELPKQFLGISQNLVNWAELSVDAALSGDKKMLYQAILANPLVRDMRAAKEVMDKMLVLNSRFLPQYKI